MIVILRFVKVWKDNLFWTKYGTKKPWVDKIGNVGWRWWVVHGPTILTSPKLKASHVEGVLGGFDIIFVRERREKILQKYRFTSSCTNKKQVSIVSASN